MNEELIKEKLIKSTKKGLDFYSKIAQNENFKHFILDLDCSELVEPDSESLRKHDLPESLKISFYRNFNSLIENINEKSCIYFFEFDQHLASTIFEKFNDFKNSGTDRNLSGIKEKPNLETQILYLGKVKKNVGARFSTHFGYANSKTGGLQLRFWAKQIDLKLKVNILVFDDNLDDFINPLELELTKELKPLIGKSK